MVEKCADEIEQLEIRMDRKAREADIMSREHL
jgi:hypothetical protein